MAKQKLDLSNLMDAESSRNNTAITGIIIMNVILALAYMVEVLKGARSIIMLLSVFHSLLPESVVSIL